MTRLTVEQAWELCRSIDERVNAPGDASVAMASLSVCDCDIHMVAGRCPKVERETR